MLDEANHTTVVAAWLERAPKDASPELLVQLLEDALAVLWQCTSNTLGDVTLTAIAGRVLYNAAEKFPMFAVLHVEPEAGIQCQPLRDRMHTSDDSDLLRQGIRFVLVEFLTVLGSLTAEILSPALHEELANVALQDQPE